MEHYLHLMKFSLIILFEHPIFGIFHSIARAMSRTSRLLLLSLAASDLGVGLLVQPLNAAMMAKMLGLAVSRHGNAVDDQEMTSLYPLGEDFPIFFYSVRRCISVNGGSHCYRQIPCSVSASKIR